jgi:glycosyltransferase involved in cell wall biosynthesis
MAPYLPQAAPLRVGYVLKRFPRLSETFILNEILELERQGVEVSVFSLLRPPAEARHKLLDKLRANVTYLPGRKALKGWEFYQAFADKPDEASAPLVCLESMGLPGAPLFPGKAPKDIWRLLFQASVLQYHVEALGLQHLHAHFGSDATTVALLAGQLAATPFSYTAHARDIYHTYVDLLSDNAMRRLKMEQAAFVATVSDYNKCYLDRLVLPAVRPRIHRLYNGIDLSLFRPREEEREEALFVGVGRLVEKKGFSGLVEACRRLKAEGRSFRCVIVGEGPERESLEAAIEAAHLGDSLELAGAKPQEDLLGIIARATAVVLPCVVTPSGDRDGLPTVLLEALALGIPCVTTRVSGNPEIVDEGETGFIVDPGEAPELAAAMARFLDDPDLSRSMAGACRRKAERDFDLKANVAKLKTLFLQASAEFQDSRRTSICA